MTLCHICQTVDIRALLLRSLETFEEPRRRQPRHPPLPDSFRHCKDLSELRVSSQGNCRFCTLIWARWLPRFKGVGEDVPLLEEELTSHGGPIYIGTTKWGRHSDEIPQITVAVGNPPQQKELCRFEVFAKRGKVPPDTADMGRLILREILPDSASPACLSIAANWLKICLAHHPHCHRASETQTVLPTRIIDVGDASKDPILLVSKGLTGAWAALSYCWGGDSEFILTETTLDSWKCDMPLHNFPKTLQDAVIVTRALGLKYLWVDALCILQDSVTDWACESVKMGDIYKGATVTISAAASAKTTAGMFSERDTSNSCGFVWRVPTSQDIRPGSEMDDNPSNLDDSGEQKVYLRPVHDLVGTIGELDSGCLAARGWVLQEDLFASRKLSYTSKVLAWECSTAIAFESGVVYLQNKEEWDHPSHTIAQKFKRLSLQSSWEVTDTPASGRNFYRLWYDIVEAYSRRSLTRRTDQLPALSGLAKYFQAMNRDSYWAGLWKGDILNGLLWSCLSEREGVKPDYIAPSWSWAALGACEVMFPIVLSTSSTQRLATVNEAGIEYSILENQFGQVRTAHLTISAPFHRLDTLSEESPAPLGILLPAFQRFVQSFLGRDLPSAEYQMQHIAYPSQHFAAVQILKRSESVIYKQPTIEFLLLESVEKSSVINIDGNCEVVYKRIGTCVLEKLGTRGKADQFDLEMGAAYDEVIKQEWQFKTFTVI